MSIRVPSILFLCFASLFSLNANSSSDQISLTCEVSGTETLSSNKYPTKTQKTPVWTATYVFKKNPSWGWTASINGKEPIRFVDSSADKDLRRVSSVNVSDQLLEVSDNFWTKHWADEDTKEEGVLTHKYSLSINRISGIVSDTNYIQIDYKNGFVSKSNRQLSGRCKSAKVQF
jgi:hypothetical protein